MGARGLGRRLVAVCGLLGVVALLTAGPVAAAASADPSTTTTAPDPTAPSNEPPTTTPPTTTEPSTTTPPTTTPPTTTPPTATAPAAQAGPITPAATPSLSVTPSTALVTGQTVAMVGTDYPADAGVGWAECKTGGGGQDDCDITNVGTTATNDSGGFSASFTVRRILRSANGDVDCASAPGTCTLGAGLLSDHSTKAGVALTFDPSAPLPPPPTLTATPTTGLVDGQQIAVHGGGFAPSAPISMSECLAATNHCQMIGGLGATVSPTGAFSTPIGVARLILTSPFGATDCAAAPGTCDLSVTSTTDSDATARVPLSFDPSGPDPFATVSITPSTNLLNFQTVTVAGHGFGTTGQFSIAQIVVCRTGSTSVDDCLNNGSTIAPLDSAGAFSTTMTMRRVVKFGSGSFDCGSAPDACELRVLSFTNPQRFGTASYSFDPSQPVPPPPAITATPDSNLHSGDTVSVTGTGFAPDEHLLVSQCPTGDDGFCGLAAPSFATTDGSGNFSATLRVARGVYDTSNGPPGVIDCASTPALCSIVAMSNDSGDEASTPVNFDPSAPLPQITVSVAPNDDLADRQVVQVDASGFEPGVPVFLGQCAPGLSPIFFLGGCTNGASSRVADSTGSVHTTLRVHRDFSPFGPGSPGGVNCAASVGTCVVQATSEFDPLVAGNGPLGFDPTAVAPGPTLTIAPPGPWTDGQTVTVHGTGFTPDAELGLAECTATGEANGSNCAPSLFDEFFADANGEFTATTTLTQSFTTSQAGPIDCATAPSGCVLFAANRNDYGAERVAVALTWVGATDATSTTRLLAFTGADDRPRFLTAGVLLALGVACLALARLRRRAA